MANDVSGTFNHSTEAKIAHQIRVEMAERRIDQQELADRAGMARSTLNHYLQGHRSVTMKTFLKVAAALDLAPSQLMDRAARPRD